MAFEVVDVKVKKTYQWFVIGSQCKTILHITWSSMWNNWVLVCCGVVFFSRFWWIWDGVNWAADDDFEPLVVTELQKGMFKKRRVVEDSTAGSDRLFKKSLFHNSQGAYSLMLRVCIFQFVLMVRCSFAFHDIEKNRFYVL